MARDIRDLLEFMEADTVETAAPSDWRQRLGARMPAAVFVGPDLPGDCCARILDEIGELNPQISVVVVDPQAQAVA